MGPCISTSSTATPDPSGARFAAFCVGLAWRATNLTFSGPRFTFDLTPHYLLSSRGQQSLETSLDLGAKTRHYIDATKIAIHPNGNSRSCRCRSR